MSPHYRAVRDGGQSTVPESHLPVGYKAAPFGVRIWSAGAED